MKGTGVNMGKLKQNIIFTVMLCLSLTLLFSGMKAYARTSVSVEGELELGAVSIDLAVIHDKTGPVLPGQRIACSPIITNIGYECYIRSSYDLGEFEKYIIPENFREDWVKCDDGYWYYTRPVNTNESVPFFSILKVSPDMPDDKSSATISVITTADAVQSKNFTPDFSSASPWSGIKTEVFSRTGEFAVSGTAEGLSALKIVYESTAEKLVANRDDFFNDIPVLMPGDSFTQNAVLQNTHDKKIDLYFYSESDLSDDLLKKMQLTISSSGKGVVYEGPLSADKLFGLQNALLLSEVPPSKNMDISFTISVPADLKNSYTLRNSSIKWVFTTDINKTIITPVPSSSGTSNPSPVRTGDGSMTGAYLMLLGSALLTLTLIKYIRSKNAKKVIAHDEGR